jgi:HSP20 family molecular chaperone IbpA
MLDIEQAIREVGTVYQALTGRPIEAGRSDLPPEIEPPARAQIEDRYRQFKSIVDSPMAGASVAPMHATWTPPIAVIESELEVHYEIDLPAVSRSEASVSVVGNFLVVRGVRGASTASTSRARYDERPSGPFLRVIALPPRARRDAIHARIHDGVLQVTVPTDGPAATTAVNIEIR